MNEQTLTGVLHRALVSRGARRVQDISEALTIAQQLAGTPSKRTLTASNDLNAVEQLRDVLTWPEVKDNPLAVAHVARALNKLR